MTNLLVDVGNTRLKWAMERDGVLGESASSAHRDRVIEEALQPIAALAARPARVVVANVGGAALGAALTELAQARFGVPAEFAAVRRDAFGLRIAYAHPERLGVDRWLGMIAARARHAGALLVVGAGTAMTIDAVDVSGAHLGGLIVPGLATMKASLLAGTAGIRDAGGAEGVPELFAADTGAAVNGGATHALAALVERAVDELARRAGAEPQLVLTGGDAERIQPLISRSGIVDPDLVLQGLVVYARGR